MDTQKGHRPSRPKPHILVWVSYRRQGHHWGEVKRSYASGSTNVSAILLST